MTERQQYRSGWADEGMVDFRFGFTIPGDPFVQKNSRQPRVVPEGKKPGAKRGAYGCPYCRGRFHILLQPSTAYAQWRRAAVKHLRTLWDIGQGLPIWLDEKRKHRLQVNAAIVSYQRTKRLADADNLYAGPQDALEEAGILENDVIIRSHDGSDRRYDKASPRVEITLTPWKASA